MFQKLLSQNPGLRSLHQFLKYHLITQLVILTVAVIIFVHYRGANKNRTIATKYQSLLSPHISKWFRKYDGQLVYESPNIYKLYPSDRQSCLFAIVSFALVPRQQILSFLFNTIFFRRRDELVVEIPINNENPLSLSAAIVRRQQIKTITKKSFPDIKQLCKQYKPSIKNQDPKDAPVKLNVPPTHCLLVQKSDHVRYFLYSQKQATTWKTHGKSVKLVYISDVNKFSRYPMAVRMVINLNADDLIPMMEWLMAFVDRMSKAKMSIGERKDAEKKRQTLKITYE